VHDFQGHRMCRGKPYEVNACLRLLFRPWGRVCIVCGRSDALQTTRLGMIEVLP
jgi:hypothetical protein